MKEIIKKYLKVLFGTAGVIFTLQSCSENLDVSPGINEIPDGYLRINLAVPDPITISTRAGGESDVNSLDVFLFNEDGTRMLQHKFYESITGNSVGMSLTGEARERKITVVAIANHEVADADAVSQIDDLKQKVLTAAVSPESGIPMFGSQGVNTSTSQTASVPVYRVAAKISVSCSVKDIVIPEFQAYRYSTDAFLGSPQNEEPYIFGGTIADANTWLNSNDFPSINSGGNESYPLVYTYPSKGETSIGRADGAFIVVQVQKPGKADQYYRIDPRIKVKEEVKEVLRPVNLLANHHYQIEVTGFISDGYDTYEEASRHPESDYFLVYTIHDHAAEVLSIITDGVHEFGVTPEADLTSSLPQATLVVKCFDASDPTSPISKDEITIPENEKSSWLNVEYKGLHAYSDDYSQVWDTDCPGAQFEFEVSINGNMYEDTDDGKITFYWRGLKREVRVTYQAAYLLPTVCTAVLTIKDNDGSGLGEDIPDYWTFIQSLGSKDSNVPKLWGILPDDMTGGKKRINGFHFPMPYGKNNPWEYEYEIDFQPLADLDDTGTTISDIRVTVAGDAFWANAINWDYSSGTSGKLTFTGDKSSYDYAGGTITFTVTFSDTGQTSDIVASLYHTGFFHYEGDTKYVPANDVGYYYYEVIQMGPSTDYWLDRNIGAKSNKSFIDYEQPMEVEERAPAGRLYTIINKPEKYHLPEWDDTMCPPGYHIPNSTEWDNLRLSKYFITESVIFDHAVYMSTFYDSPNSKIGKIYFPKARFRNADGIWTEAAKYSMEPNNGDAGAGYYWTVSEAPAMEKEQMGNWLRALYLNGSASAYINASITDHRMPVRCKAGLASQATVAKDYYISFNVHNVTHVYLFDPSTKTPLYTFPGKAVGSSKSSVKWQNFYCSTTTNPTQLLVLFVKLEDDGRVLVHTKEGSKFISTVNYSDRFLSLDYAWEIVNGQYYDFCDVALGRDGDYLCSTQPGDCITTSEDENQGGGGGSGGGGLDVNPDDYTFTPEDSSEKVVSWTKKTLVNYGENDKCQDLAYGAFNWAQVVAGSVLKIYTVDVGEGYNLQVFNGGWSMLYDIKANDSKIHSSIVGDGASVIEIELTKDILQNFINNQGMIIQGKNCVLLGMTIVEGEVQLASGPYSWTGRMDANNWSNQFTELAATAYDWSGVKSGSTLTFEFTSSGQPQIKIRLAGNDQEVPGIPDYTPWNGSLTNFYGQEVTITLNDTMLNAIKANGGIVFTGGAYVLTRVELKMAN